MRTLNSQQRRESKVRVYPRESVPQKPFMESITGTQTSEAVKAEEVSPGSAEAEGAAVAAAASRPAYPAHPVYR